MNLIPETAQKITKNRTFNVFIFILILFLQLLSALKPIPELLQSTN